MEHTHVVFHHKLRQEDWVVGYLVAGQCQGETVVQRNTDFLDRGIEGDGGQSEYALHLLHYRPITEIERMGKEFVTDTLVMKHHTLWTTCRT